MSAKGAEMDEPALIAQFRNVIATELQSAHEQEWCTDYCLRRFLRARNHDLHKAHVMLTKCLEWRREYKPHEITFEEVEWQMKCGKNFLHGFDEQGRPVIVMRCSLDTPYEREKKMRLMVFQIETAIRLMELESAKRGPDAEPIERMVWVVDLSNYAWGTMFHDTRVGPELAGILQNYYPERLGRMLLCQPMLIFWGFWKIISPFVDKRTSQNVVFLRGSEESIRDGVQKELGEQWTTECYDRIPDAYQHDPYFEWMRTSVWPDKCQAAPDGSEPHSSEES